MCATVFEKRKIFEFDKAEVKSESDGWWEIVDNESVVLMSKNYYRNKCLECKESCVNTMVFRAEG